MRQFVIDEGFLRILGVDPDIFASTLGEEQARAVARQALDAYFDQLTAPWGEGHRVRVRIEDCDRLPKSWSIECAGDDAAIEAMMDSLLANVGLHEFLRATTTTRGDE